MGDVILTMKDIDKSFPGVHALDHVNFEVRRGEVHALMGENGAGKSTLMKVLTGIYQKDSGSITYKGQEVAFHNTREAQDNGVVIVHQELNMVGDLTAAQNIFIGREPKKGIRVDDKKMIEDSKKLFKDLNIEIDPREKMSNLTVGKQQMCEIAKAISHKAEVIIFDEPSAALTEKEIADLFVIIRDLREKNLGIVYISHRMDEIKVITDRVTVMRDGGYVGTLITKDSTKEDIINMMVGRVIYEDPKEHSMVSFVSNAFVFVVIFPWPYLRGSAHGLPAPQPGLPYLYHVLPDFPVLTFLFPDLLIPVVSDTAHIASASAPRH